MESSIFGVRCSLFDVFKNQYRTRNIELQFKKYSSCSKVAVFIFEPLVPPTCFTTMPNIEKPIIIYDGECKLCRQAVTFLKKDEDYPGFRFIPSSDPDSDSLLDSRHIPRKTTNSTMILFKGEKTYTKSTAVIKALVLRGGLWKIALILLLIPPFLRNLVYDWIAGRRK